MTRFMMSLDEAVDLVLYAFAEAEPGDLFVQKSPAATIGTLAEALKRVFRAGNPVSVIGVRHGEKIYETLLTREERARACESERYFRVPTDTRDLNYSLYFTEGTAIVAELEDYTSHNTRRLNVEEMAVMLKELSEVKEAMAKLGVA
jgi:UDP-glucose 4-epimerase